MRMTAGLPARAQYIAASHPYAWSLILVAVATGLLWLIQAHINAENVALFYLVAVLLCAVTAGRAPAVLEAVVSFLAFKFFFVEPIFSFTIDNMLDLTRIEASVLRPQRGWYNVAEIIDHVLQRLVPNLEGHPIDLNVPDDLPLMLVDYVQLEQMLWNLLQNALTYAPPDSSLLIEATQQANAIVLCVGYRGPVIPHISDR